MSLNVRVQILERASTRVTDTVLRIALEQLQGRVATDTLLAADTLVLSAVNLGNLHVLVALPSISKLGPSGGKALAVSTPAG